MLVLPVVMPVERSALHTVQSALEDFPSSIKYVSTPHSLHDVSPLPSWYWPAGHAEQSWPTFKLNLPRSHFVQEREALVGASSPFAHRVQCGWSVSLCAYPLGHSVHTSIPLTSFLNLPGAQSEHLVLPALEVRPGAHWSHGLCRFLSVAKEFSEQRWHFLAPVALLNSPCTLNKNKNNDNATKRTENKEWLAWLAWYSNEKHKATNNDSK